MNVSEQFGSWLREIDTSQWRSPTALWRHQREALVPLLIHAKRTTPFYRTRLDPVVRGDRIDLAGWNEIPVTTRDELLDHNEELHSDAVPAGHGSILPRRTSGSTGKPLRLVTTTLATMRGLGLVHRGLTWHGFDFRRKLATIRSDGDWSTTRYPHGGRQTYWSPAARYLGLAGELVRLDIQTPVELQVEWLRRQRPTYLYTYPSNAAAIARQAAGEPIEELKKIIVGGETVTDETRELCRRHLGADLVGRYGAHDGGHLALQCPTGNQYHLFSENAVIEVLGPDGRQVGPGQCGQLVVTNLNNYAFPLIRYLLGDYVQVGGPCGCGRGLPVLDSILGRQRSMFRFPDGTQVWPTITRELEQQLPARQWQVAQVGPIEIEIRYVPKASASPVDFDALTASICDRFGKHLNIRYRVYDEIPRESGGKFHDYVCEL